MTFKNNEFSHEFKKRFSSVFSKEYVQTFIGFLCFDHIKTEYFTKKDRSIGFIFADLLSLYFLIRIIKTSLSTKYKEISSYLSKWISENEEIKESNQAR